MNADVDCFYRMVAHQMRIARINRTGWQYEPAADGEVPGRGRDTARQWLRWHLGGALIHLGEWLRPSRPVSTAANALGGPAGEAGTIIPAP